MAPSFCCIAVRGSDNLSAPLAAETIEGYLIDKLCSAKVAEEGVEAAKAHTKDCALAPDCKASGYGVVTADGKVKDGSITVKAIQFS